MRERERERERERLSGGEEEGRTLLILAQIDDRWLHYWVKHCTHNVIQTIIRIITIGIQTQG